jgi:5-methylcytosine-specific restriction endonuclease McrA
MELLRNGTPVKAEVLIHGAGHDWVVVFEGRSGRTRNPEYNVAVETVFERFGQRGARLVGAELATGPAMRLEQDERWLDIEYAYPYPVSLDGVDASRLRSHLAGAQRGIKTAPDRKSGGNGSNRMRVWISLRETPSSDVEFLEWLYRGNDEMSALPIGGTSAGTSGDDMSGIPRGRPPMPMDSGLPFDSKQAVYDRLHDALGLERRLLAHGGTPHADLIDAAAIAMRVDTSACANKVEAARLIVDSCGGAWVAGEHDSTRSESGGGGNITAAGLRGLLAVLEEPAKPGDSGSSSSALIAGYLIAAEGVELEWRECVPAPLTTEQPATRRARDHRVVAAVLQIAGGTCEACGEEGPFEIVAGEYRYRFLEVHHVRPLAEDGSDRPENAIAVCPNCHRALHYAPDRAARRLRLFQSISRLELE